MMIKAIAIDFVLVYLSEKLMDYYFDLTLSLLTKLLLYLNGMLLL